MAKQQCRICLSEGSTISIFYEQDSPKISTKIMSLAKIQIYPEDGLPSSICRKCVKKLDLCIEFVQLCRNSDSKLRALQCLNKNTLETDIDLQTHRYNEELSKFSPKSDSTKDLIVDESTNLSFCNENEFVKTEVELNDSYDELKIKNEKKTEKQQCFTCGKVMSSSGPSRGALLAARAIGAPVSIVQVNLFKKEQFNEAFLKVNPQHCIPTLEDDGFVVWESRAISSYLADKFAKDDQLYPKDLKRRALVNQRLYFDASSLYVKIRAICFPILFRGETEIKKDLKDDLNATIGFLELFLTDSKWVAGDNYTIADCSIYASLSSILAVGWDISAFPNIQRWVKDCAVLPGYEENEAGAKQFGESVKKNLKQ